MNTKIVTGTKWMYPDEELVDIRSSKVSLISTINGTCEFQMICNNQGDNITYIDYDNKENFNVETYRMIEIPVENNSVSIEENDGEYIETDLSKEKPLTSTRKAPFIVYDCLKQVSNKINSITERLALYFCIKPKENIRPGNYVMNINIRNGEEKLHIITTIKIYNVKIPEKTLSITNWFNLDNTASYHKIEYMSEEHFKMLRKYAKAMLRARQTHFFLSIDERMCRMDLEKMQFDFTNLKRVAEIFFDEGLQKMELGNFAVKYPDLFAPDLKLNFNREIKINEQKGYKFLCEFIKQLSEFLQENNWDDKVIFHICDEPDDHLEDDREIVGFDSEEILLKRQRDYLTIANILRRNIPKCKIIEAVKTPKLKSGVDIWVPLTLNYEKYREEFDEMKRLGDEVWIYVCCCPGAKYLNRFLDIDLIKPRLIFWGCSKYDLTGYLHWGFNYYHPTQNPFEQSCCYNDTEHGTDYPSGDSHIVYPGLDEPLISMRLEAQRKGAEDYELLTMLKEKNICEYNKIMDTIFRNNSDYNTDIEEFDNVYENILMALETEINE